MRNLSHEVVAAIETAVDVNDGVLDSALIHSLAKIYKTSPQAVVWNMKRHNKVKAGCDDRKPSGRLPSIDKDKAAEYLRILMIEAHVAGENITHKKAAEIVSKEFKIGISSTWVSRVMKRYKINPRMPELVAATSSTSSWVPQYDLPAPGQSPSLRKDLQQAVGDLAPPAPPSLPQSAPIYSYHAPSLSVTARQTSPHQAAGSVS